MALTEETINDQIQVVNNGTFPVVQVRQATIIKRDGTEISRTYHRYVVYPNDDLTNLDSDVVAICNPVFTQSVIDTFNGIGDE